MIKVALLALKERSGSSRQAIEKYIKANYSIGDVGSLMKMALKRVEGDKTGLSVSFYFTNVILLLDH